MDQILAIVGAVITVISLIYAIYVNRKHSKLINYNRDQAWELYRQSSKVLGFYQELEKVSTDNKEIIINTAKGESASPINS